MEPRHVTDKEQVIYFSQCSTSFSTTRILLYCEVFLRTLVLGAPNATCLDWAYMPYSMG